MKNTFRLAAAAIIVTLAGCAAMAEAQQVAKVRLIGFLSPLSLTPGTSATLEAFRQGLREPGWVEGQNIGIERRYADGQYERLPDLAAELVRLRVDVIFATTSPAALAESKIENPKSKIGRRADKVIK